MRLIYPLLVASLFAASCQKKEGVEENPAEISSITPVSAKVQSQSPMVEVAEVAEGKQETEPVSTAGPVSALVPETALNRVPAGVEDTEVTTEFVFTNTGEKPVRVLGLDSSCACLTAVVNKQVFAAGEKGTVTATFKLGERAGVHQKGVLMKTSEPGEPEVRFSVAVEIPEIIRIEPDLIQWTIGETPTPKKFTVTFSGDDLVRIKSIESSRKQQVPFDLKEVEEGRKYEIVLSPVGTDQVVNGGLFIKTDSPIPKYARRTAYFQISKPRKPRK